MLPRLLLSTLLVLLTLAPPQQRCVQHVETLNYPVVARQAGITGEARLSIQIDSSGRVQSAHEQSEYVGSAHPLFVNAAIENVKKWKFEPGEKEDRNVSFVFQLQPQPLTDAQSACVFDLPDKVTVLAQIPPVNF